MYQKSHSLQCFTYVESNLDPDQLSNKLLLNMFSVEKFLKSNLFNSVRQANQYKIQNPE